MELRILLLLEAFIIDILDKEAVNLFRPFLRNGLFVFREFYKYRSDAGESHMEKGELCD